MKVLKVETFAEKIRITALIFGKERVIEGRTKEEVAKKAMKECGYFTRDQAILQDMELVYQEQESGLREDPNKVVAELAA